jgi:Neuraminidase (sialidase)
VTRRGFLLSSNATIFWRRPISTQPDLYHGWPTLARRANGELLLVYSGGREAHVCPFGRVELMRSRDDGETWSHPEVLWDSVIDDRDAGILITAAGTILVTTFTSIYYQRTRKPPEGWASVERRSTQAQREALLGSWMLRSTDGGLTWSAPYRVPVNSPHGPVNGANGRLWYPGKRLYGEREGEIGVAESGDDGATWRWTEAIPTRPGDEAAQYHELHGVEVGGRRVVQIRNHNPANAQETLQSVSSGTGDGGRSWSVPAPIGVWGLPSHLLALRDGRLLMTYGYRRAPFGNQARVSEDQGRTWQAPVILSEDSPGTDVGYPSTVELSDGRLLTAWYEKTAAAPKAVLRLAAWRL